MGSESDVDRWVARRLGELRKERRLTLAALAERTGISAAHLSRLEKGERQPSIGALLQLARAYGLSLSRLVEDDEPDSYRVARGDTAPVRAGRAGTYQVLSGTGGAVSVLRVEFAPGTHPGAVPGGGEEWLYVLSGSVTVVLDDEGAAVAGPGADGTHRITLAAGDALHFDPSRPHHVVNESAEPVPVLVVTALRG